MTKKGKIKLWQTDDKAERLIAATASTDDDLIPCSETGRVLVTGPGYGGRRILLGEFSPDLLYMKNGEALAMIDHIRFGPHRKPPNGVFSRDQERSE